MIQKHVTSLELSKKLQKAGWKRRCQFQWGYGGDMCENDWTLFHCDNEACSYSEFYEAPLLSELLEELPRETSIKKAYNNTYLARSYRSNDKNHRYVENADNPSDALAQLLLTLIDEGIITL